MINKFTDKIINELNTELKFIPEFKGIYLFGSHAKGTANKNSDYDLAVIIDNNKILSVKEEIRKVIYRKMLKYDIIIDNPFINYDDLLIPDSYLKQRIQNEGIFYEK